MRDRRQPAPRRQVHAQTSMKTFTTRLSKDIAEALLWDNCMHIIIVHECIVFAGQLSLLCSDLGERERLEMPAWGPITMHRLSGYRKHNVFHWNWFITFVF